MEAITYYYQYGQPDPGIRDFINRVNDMRYTYYASELLKKLVQSPDFDFEQAVRKAIVICKMAGLPVQEHFTAVYRSEHDGIARDWKLSELACGFILVSFHPASDEGEEIQQAFIRYNGL